MMMNHRIQVRQIQLNEIVCGIYLVNIYIRE